MRIWPVVTLLACAVTSCGESHRSICKASLSDNLNLELRFSSFEHVQREDLGQLASVEDTDFYRARTTTKVDTGGIPTNEFICGVERERSTCVCIEDPQV
jgi:hypothetical protein